MQHCFLVGLSHTICSGSATQTQPWSSFKMKSNLCIWIYPGENQLRSDKGTVHSFAGHWHFLTRSCCVFSFHRPEISFRYSFDSDLVFPVMLSAIEHLHMRNALDVMVRWLYTVAVSYVFEVFGSDTHLYALTTHSAVFHVAGDTFVR